ncbi:hypothetical protein KQX54_015244 [Cotesia glomerata]|uniref:Uncharacterized protein n=1 Tax=Cotesia glomerata TaxID=32391 RepID=A0AAV7IYS2_COTGL|nr:hypothetical protein KQX54_015244 [Cotesia glomerata]
MTRVEMNIRLVLTYAFPPAEGCKAEEAEWLSTNFDYICCSFLNNLILQPTRILFGYRDLQGNNISVVFKTDFEDMATLHALQLSNNQIHTIERGAFKDLVAVEKLRLNNNQIRYLPDTLFSNMMNLRRLRTENRDEVCWREMPSMRYIHHLTKWPDK